jgi:hypothetical protein
MTRVLAAAAAVFVLAAAVAARADEVPKEAAAKAYTISITGVG